MVRIHAIEATAYSGSEVINIKSIRGHLLQDTLVEREISHQALQSHMLLFQALQPFGLIHPQPAVFFLPPVVGLFRDPQLPTGLDHRKPFAQLDFDGCNCPMISSAVYRFRAMPPPFAGRNLNFSGQTSEQTSDKTSSPRSSTSTTTSTTTTTEGASGPPTDQTSNPTTPPQ
jgi:hypothetical protein